MRKRIGRAEAKRAVKCLPQKGALLWHFHDQPFHNFRALKSVDRLT